MPNCTYSLGNNLALVAPTNQLSSDEGLICHQRNDLLTLETNQVTIRIPPGNSLKIHASGAKLPHLVGNCQQEQKGGELWLQMGPEHCIRIWKGEKKSWISAEQFCQREGHLIALHNSLDEKLVQNLVFNR